ncbi:hypothetical protein QFZ87_003592 [Bacillus sp. SLBN-46]|uniref:hypothetical protein n=1 Tax=Bacillus sp. SLBN-46 TaxID=3042283 RepID=UPI00285CD528|nr:hypothetical protein [Bacillus sp. SLBN-46]MDR6123995.1 hypothetical protein [Bacillus sp. SLBN-46]
MEFERQKAIMLAENITSFIKFVNQRHENKNNFRIHSDKLYQIKLLTEEYKFQIIADELLRINQFDWDGKYTYYLVDQFQNGMNIIDEYVQNHYNDLFLLTARIHTLKNLNSPFNK